MPKLTEYEIIHTFTILHNGWEMNNTAWIAKNKKGQLVLLSTSHGGLRDDGADLSALRRTREETQQSLDGIDKAIQLMGG